MNTHEKLRAAIVLLQQVASELEPRGGEPVMLIPSTLDGPPASTVEIRAMAQRRRPAHRSMT